MGLYYLLQEPSCPHCRLLTSLHKSNDIVCMGQCIEFLLNSVSLFSSPLLEFPCCLNDHSFTMSLENKTSNLFCFFKIILTVYFWTLALVYKFQRRFTKFQKTSWILIALNLQFNLGKVVIFKLSLPIYEYGASFIYIDILHFLLMFCAIPDQSQNSYFVM